MGRKFYLWIRDLHLYFGLLVSPFVIVFALSVFFLTHSWEPATGKPVTRTVSGVKIPDGVETLEGRARVDGIRPVLDDLGIRGEVDYIILRQKQRHLIVPVKMPGAETTVDFDLNARTAKISQRSTGLREELIYLHKSPGPHNANIRGNWVFTRIWGWLADGIVYLVLFLSASGIYLWAVLRAERRIGLVLIGAGAVTFIGVIYALCA